MLQLNHSANMEGERLHRLMKRLLAIVEVRTYTTEHLRSNASLDGFMRVGRG